MLKKEIENSLKRVNAPCKHRKEKIIIIDFGSQVTKLIARRIRDLRSFFRRLLLLMILYKIKKL